MESRRRKRLLIALITGVTTFALVWVISDRPEPEPSYQGRPLSQWLDQMNQLGWDASEEAKEAVRAIGTNAFPTCLDWLSYESSPTRDKLAALATRISPRLGDRFYSEEAKNADLAPWVFYILRSEAGPALPKLVRLAQTASDPERAVAALANIGPAALPSVLVLVTNSPTRTRMAAISMLEVFGTNAVVAVPVLVPMLADPDPDIRSNTAIALSNIAPKAITNAAPQ